MPMNRQPRRFGKIFQNVVDFFIYCAGRVFRENKFVQIDEGHAAAKEAIIIYGLVVSFKLHSFSGKIFACDQARFDIRRDNLSIIVGAFVIVKIKVVDTRKQMIIEPLFKIMPLVF